jgi:hypothetical protein
MSIDIKNLYIGAIIYFKKNQYCSGESFKITNMRLSDDKKSVLIDVGYRYDLVVNIESGRTRMDDYETKIFFSEKDAAKFEHEDKIRRNKAEIFLLQKEIKKMQTEILEHEIILKNINL